MALAPPLATLSRLAGGEPTSFRKATVGGFSAEVSTARQLAMGTPPTPGDAPLEPPQLPKL